MKTAKEMYNYSKRNGFGKGASKTWSLKHLKIVQNSLKKNENVKISFLGFHNYKSLSDHDNIHAYALTNKRMIIGHKKFIGQFYKSISYKYLNDISLEGKLVSSIITIDTMKDTFNVNTQNKKGSKKLISRIQNLLDERELKNENGTTTTNNKKSKVEELKELNGLLKDGVIDKDEFEDLKSDIIN